MLLLFYRDYVPQLWVFLYRPYFDSCTEMFKAEKLCACLSNTVITYTYGNMSVVNLSYS